MAVRVPLDSDRDIVPKGWGVEVLSDCWLPADAVHPAAKIRVALLDHARGIALIDMAPNTVPDAIERFLLLYHQLFPEVSKAPPVVYRSVSAADLLQLKTVLDEAFADTAPLEADDVSLDLDDVSWMEMARQVLSLEAGPQPGMQAGAAAVPDAVTEAGTGPPKPTKTAEPMPGTAKAPLPDVMADLLSSFVEPEPPPSPTMSMYPRLLVALGLVAGAVPLGYFVVLGYFALSHEMNLAGAPRPTEARLTRSQAATGDGTAVPFGSDRIAPPNQRATLASLPPLPSGLPPLLRDELAPEASSGPVEDSTRSILEAGLAGEAVPGPEAAPESALSPFSGGSPEDVAAAPAGAIDQAVATASGPMAGVPPDPGTEPVTAPEVMPATIASALSTHPHNEQAAGTTLMSGRVPEGTPAAQAGQPSGPAGLIPAIADRGAILGEPLPSLAALLPAEPDGSAVAPPASSEMAVALAPPPLTVDPPADMPALASVLPSPEPASVATAPAPVPATAELSVAAPVITPAILEAEAPGTADPSPGDPALAPALSQPAPAAAEPPASATAEGLMPADDPPTVVPGLPAASLPPAAEPQLTGTTAPAVAAAPEPLTEPVTAPMLALAPRMAEPLDSTTGQMQEAARATTDPAALTPASQSEPLPANPARPDPPKADGVASAPGALASASPALPASSPEQAAQSEPAPASGPAAAKTPATPSAPVVTALVAPPPAPVARPAASSPVPPVSMAPELLDALVRRGNAMLAVGDVSAARLLFERAAAAGSATAATGLGRTYDPLVLETLSVRGLRPDPDMAASWYQRAVAMGDPAAKLLAQHLGARRQGGARRSE
jgi:hypothetical protein